MEIAAGWEEPVHVLSIISDDEYVGKVLYCVAKYDDDTVYPGDWAITSGNQYATINANGRVDIVSGTVEQTIVVQCSYGNVIQTKQVVVSYDNQFTIDCDSVMRGTSGNVLARFNFEIVTPVYQIISGGTHATIDATGAVTILSSGNITIEATYNGYTKTKDVSLIYEQNISSETVVNDDGSVTTTVTETTVGQDGVTTATSVSNTTNSDGSTAYTETTTETQQDGSSTTISNTTNSDGTTSDTEISVAADGSSTSQTTNYDVNGDPTTGSNNTTDVLGNSNTQEVEYDSEGNTTVTNYTIDTTNNTSGSGEPFRGSASSGDVLNTEYYAFDTTQAFECLIHFKFDTTNQPDTQSTVLNVKRADPQPWYGFDIRRKDNNNIRIGCQFEGGTNNQPYIKANSDYIFKVKITYDPTVPTGGTTFTVYDMINNKSLFTAKNKIDASTGLNLGIFPDIPEMKYIKVTLGCNIDKNGNPQRYANVDIYEFYIRRIEPANPQT